jgi:hypothetical protein
MALWNPIDAIGKWWLSGNKYKVSKFLAGSLWNEPIENVLKDFEIDTTKVTGLYDTVALLTGKVFWVEDSLYSAIDTVRSPRAIFERSGDDCDGLAGLHAKLINFVLRSKGYEAYIVSYLANPWTFSHHFCAVKDPNGVWFAVQPQPTEHDFLEGFHDCVYGAWENLDDMVHAIAAGYDSEVVWMDLRNDNWEVVAQKP